MKLVKQIDDDGCFVAACAMLLNVSYQKAKKIVHSKKKSINGLPTNMASKKLNELGFKPRKAKVKKIKKLKKNALIIIRWTFCPELTHALVWDSKAKKILDPWRRLSHFKYESQLEMILYVDVKAARQKLKNEKLAKNK